MSQPINLSDLTSSGLVIELDSNFVFDEDEPPLDGDEVKRKMQHLTLDVLEETENDVPFNILVNKMEPILPDKKIHKRIIQEGKGDKLNEYSQVTIHYNAYFENDPVPFDSTYGRGKPWKFTIGLGEVLPGLDISVQSMRLHEISQFLVHPVYAYGRGFLKIPPDSTILFLIELVEVLDIGGIYEFKNLDDEGKKEFPNAYKYCASLCERGKDHFKRGRIDKAINDYNVSLTQLDKVTPLTEEDLRNQYDLKMRLFSNLIICHAKNMQWIKGIKVGEKAMKFCQNDDISGKLLYNYGRCLRQNCLYSEAQEILFKALQKLPKDSNISNELTNLRTDMLKDTEKQKNLAKAFLNA